MLATTDMATSLRILKKHKGVVDEAAIELMTIMEEKEKE